jgi:hypothetical protein
MWGNILSHIGVHHTIFQVLAAHDAILNEYWSDHQKKYISIELRPHAIICAFILMESEGWRSSLGYKILQ